jgi:hypothetical protein
MLVRLSIWLTGAAARCLRAARWCAIGRSGVRHHPGAIERTGEAGSEPAPPSDQGKVMAETYYVAAPIARRDDGALVEDQAVRCVNAEHAIAVAEIMASEPHYAGAWAYCRTGDPTTGWFEPAEVLKRFGPK